MTGPLPRQAWKRLYLCGKKVEIEDYGLSEQGWNIIYKIIIPRFESCSGVEDLINNGNYFFVNPSDDPFYICYMVNDKFFGHFGNKFDVEGVVIDFGISNVWVYDANTCEQLNIKLEVTI